MITSRALSEHKQRQRLNFLERVKQETHTTLECFNCHSRVYVPHLVQFDRTLTIAECDNCKLPGVVR